MRFKKASALTMAAVMTVGSASLAIQAATPVNLLDSGSYHVMDDDYEILEDTNGSAYDMGRVVSGGTITLDYLEPDQTFYIPLGIGYGGSADDPATTLSGSGQAYASELVDDDLFKISIDKSGSGKSLIKSITQVSEKNAGEGRGSYLKVVLNGSTTTDELKAVADITFKSKKAMTSATSGYNGNTWSSGETAEMRLTMWINNKEVKGTDGEAETGEAIYFDPDSNETNTLIWGDDRAALAFDSDDDASKFYAKLSTKSNSEIYAEYGDPVDADLWFYDFVGNPTIPSTSRATLTLGIPWDEDDDYAPYPEDCYIYQLDSDGYLTDVTASFTYSDDNSATGIEGWSIKTRTLGTYVVSDTELDLDYYDDADDDLDDGEDTDGAADGTTSSDSEKPIPNTGSSDLVNVASAAAILSLVCAGALAFKKATK